jgi:hypothetical protein
MAIWHYGIIKIVLAWCQWLKPIILTTQEAEIRRIEVQNQPRLIVYDILSQNTPHKKGR